MPLKEFKIDSKDREIITLLIENPDISQKEIAERIKLTQPSVAMRLKKLKRMGAIEKRCGIDPLKLGLYIAKVDIATADTSRIINMFRDCPYFLNGFILSGKNNVLSLIHI